MLTARLVSVSINSIFIACLEIFSNTMDWLLTRYPLHVSSFATNTNNRERVSFFSCIKMTVLSYKILSSRRKLLPYAYPTQNPSIILRDEYIDDRVSVLSFL